MAFQTRDSARIPSASYEELERERSKVSVYQVVNFIQPHARSSSVSAFEALATSFNEVESSHSKSALSQVIIVHQVLRWSVSHQN